MKFLRNALKISIFAISLTGMAIAAEADRKFPTQLEVGGKTLKLNGVGTRKATFLKVKVYDGALYLESPSQDGEAIKNSNQLKRIELRFLRDVEKNKIQEAWTDNFNKRCGNRCDALRPELEKLNGMMPDFKTGDVMIYTFYPDRMEASVKDKKATVTNPEFNKILVSAWLGPDPQDEGLSEGMLGK